MDIEGAVKFFGLLKKTNLVGRIEALEAKNRDLEAQVKALREGEPPLSLFPAQKKEGPAT